MTRRLPLFRKPTPFALELIKLFHLSPKDAATAESVFSTVTVPAGTELSWEGSGAKQLVLVLDGEVEVTRNGELVTVLGPGGVLGEITALGVRTEQTASAVTTKETRIAAAGTSDLGRIREVTGLYLHMQHLASVRTLAPGPLTHAAPIVVLSASAPMVPNTAVTHIQSPTINPSR